MSAFWNVGIRVQSYRHPRERTFQYVSRIFLFVTHNLIVMRFRIRAFNGEIRYRPCRG